MTTIRKVAGFLEEFAPVTLAEDWDNVGLLVGDPNTRADKVMTCLTVTPESAAEAIENQANLIVTHHPMPFASLKRITSETTTGQLLIDLIRAGVAVYSPHTAFDSARSGINQQLTERFGLINARPIINDAPDNPDVGTGRIASLPESKTLEELVNSAKKLFELEHIRYVGKLDLPITHVGFACGSGGSFLPQALSAGCDALVTGETNFHTCLEAKARGIGLVLLGHFFSERFAVVSLVDVIQGKFPEIHAWASQAECDPLNWA